MLIAERRERAYIRKSPGFTLGEAARIRRDVLASKADLECPRCAGKVDVVGAREPGEIVWITTCSDCRLSVVVHGQTGGRVDG